MRVEGAGESFFWCRWMGWGVVMGVGGFCFEMRLEGLKVREGVRMVLDVRRMDARGLFVECSCW